MLFLPQNISRLSQAARTVISNMTPVQQRFAARKGTRERKAKKKVVKEVTKQAWMPVQKSKAKLLGPARANDDNLSLPTDDVWFLSSHKVPIYSFEEAIRFIEEVHHPEIFNQPLGLVNAFIELDMSTNKKTKFVERFSRLVGTPHPYDHGETRSVLAFCKDHELQREANEAGATLCGGTDIVKSVDRGQIMLPDFDFVVAHPDIMPELVSLRQLMKKQFPSLASGTLGVNIGGLVKKCLHGVRYNCLRHETEQNYGYVDVTLGPLSMKVTDLEENFVAIIKDIDSKRPRRESPFITRCMLSTPLLTDRLYIQWRHHIEEEPIDEDADSDDESEEVVVKKSA